MSAESRFKFNQITDEGAEGLRSYYQKLIDANAHGQDRYEAEMTLGFLAWRDGDVTSMNHHFSYSARLVVDLLESFNKTGMQRNINQFITPLFIATIFCSENDRIRLEKIPQNYWFYPVVPEYVPLADFLVLVNKIFISKTINLSDVDRLIIKNNKLDASEYYQPWINASCHALRAIKTNDVSALIKEIRHLLILHERETEEGAWKKLAEGIVSLWALLIYRISAQFLMSIVIKSPYLPQ